MCPEVLAEVGRDHRIALVTKGDLVHQWRKVRTSGLEHHFELIEVVMEKDVETYARIIRLLDVDPARFCMVGNSVPSDVLPVLALGGHAVHVPYRITWHHEMVDHDKELDELAVARRAPGLAPPPERRPFCTLKSARSGRFQRASRCGSYARNRC